MRPLDDIRADLDPTNPHRQGYRERLLADVGPLLDEIQRLREQIPRGALDWYDHTRSLAAPFPGVSGSPGEDTGEQP